MRLRGHRVERRDADSEIGDTVGVRRRGNRDYFLMDMRSL